MTLVKICGIKDVANAMAAVEAGADFLGFVFAPSKRRITPEKAREIIEAVRRHKPQSGTPIPEIVGVFVNSSIGEVLKIAEYCQLDRVQLSGDESWEYCCEIERPVMKVIHVHGKTRRERSRNDEIRSVVSEIEKGYKLIPPERLTYLLDSRVGNTFGGTGKTFDWKIAAEIAKTFPVIVAGGLTPENVGELVRRVKPFGVDVSGGVETDGKKDALKIKEFVLVAKAC